MQSMFVDGRCQYLFMEMEMAYGDFSSELVANPPPGTKGLPGGRTGNVLYYGLSYQVSSLTAKHPKF